MNSPKKSNFMGKMKDQIKEGVERSYRPDVVSREERDHLSM